MCLLLIAVVSVCVCVRAYGQRPVVEWWVVVVALGFKLKYHRSCLAHASKFFLLYERPSPKNISQWSGVSGILDNDGAGDDEGPVAHEP